MRHAQGAQRGQCQPASEPIASFAFSGLRYDLIVVRSLNGGRVDCDVRATLRIASPAVTAAGRQQWRNQRDRDRRAAQRRLPSRMRSLLVNTSSRIVSGADIMLAPCVLRLPSAVPAHRNQRKSGQHFLPRMQRGEGKQGRTSKSTPANSRALSHSRRIVINDCVSFCSQCTRTTSG